MVITGWDQGCLGMKIGEVRKLARRYWSKFMRANLCAWHALAAHNMGLIRDVVDRWRQRGREIVELPFKAWFLFMDRRRS